MIAMYAKCDTITKRSVSANFFKLKSHIGFSLKKLTFKILLNIIMPMLPVSKCHKILMIMRGFTSTFIG